MTILKSSKDVENTYQLKHQLLQLFNMDTFKQDYILMTEMMHLYRQLQMRL